MNDLDRRLGRLLRNAATAPSASARLPAAPALPFASAAPALPFAVEARVLAAWRTSRAEGSADIAGLLRFFRYGFACACAVAIVAVGLSWRGVQSEATDEFALSNAEMNVAMLR
jgi:anti-sigma-K factor RskA